LCRTLGCKDFFGGAVESAGARFFRRGDGAALSLGRLAARPFDGAHDPVASLGRELQEPSRGGFEREAVLVLAAGGKRPKHRYGDAVFGFGGRVVPAPGRPV